MMSAGKQSNLEKEKVKGIVFVDRPRDFSVFSEDEEFLFCSGWELSNSDHSEFEITLDDQPVENVIRSPRQDVYDVYAESYLGFIDKNTLGWQVNIPLKHCEKGTHKIRVYNHLKDQMLAEKEIVFTIE